MSLTGRRLEKLYQRADVIPYDSNSKFIIMSDCHRGQGNSADDFLQNQILFFGALEYYEQEGFTYIELGDGDELWENRKLEPIVEVHSDAFWMMSNFYKTERFYMIYGNHDIVKHRKGYMKNNCTWLIRDNLNTREPVFADMEAREGLVLENKESKQRIFCAHGHQGDVLNDVFWPIARFLVRYVWQPLQFIGVLDPTGSGRPHEKKDKIEKKLAAYARKKKNILIAGHTHRPYFSVPGKGFYFNDGSCVHPRCITGIEIVNNEITLIKWSVCIRRDLSLYVCREILEGPVSLNEYK